MPAKAMSADRRIQLTQHPSRLCAWLVLAVTLMFGGLGGAWLMGVMVADATRASRQDAQVFGQSVARSIAHQFDRALAYGIAVEEVRGTEAYLKRLLEDTPGLRRIELLGAQLQPVQRVGLAPIPSEVLASVPIVFEGRTVGQVGVALSLRRLEAYAQWWWLYLTGVLGVALAAAWWAGAGPGAELERRCERLLRGLKGPLAGGLSGLDVATGEGAGQPVGGDTLDAALRALDAGELRLREKRAAFEALAQELLEVDFDDRLAPEIERLRQRVGHMLSREVP
jgi:hypothetical protein